MKITRITLYTYNVPLKAPITISLGTIDAARNRLVQIDTDEGLTGGVPRCAYIWVKTHQDDDSGQ